MPVDAGTSNDYAYVDDPINDFDLDGKAAWHCQASWSKEKCSQEVKKEKAKQDAVTRKCAAGVKGAAEFFGWRFAFSAANQFRQGNIRGTLEALGGGWGTYSPAAVKRAAPRVVGRVVGKIAGTPTGIVGTIVDYSC